MQFPSGYEWDNNKNALNKTKHGYGFESAVDIFKQSVYESLPFVHNGEERKFAIGSLQGEEVTVIFCERSGKRRIISIRRARDYERNIYKQFIIG